MWIILVLSGAYSGRTKRQSLQCVQFRVLNARSKVQAGSLRLLLLHVPRGHVQLCWKSAFLQGFVIMSRMMSSMYHIWWKPLPFKFSYLWSNACEKSLQCQCGDDPGSEDAVMPGSRRATSGGSHFSSGAVSGKCANLFTAGQQGQDGRRLSCEADCCAEHSWACRGSAHRCPRWCEEFVDLYQSDGHNLRVQGQGFRFQDQQIPGGKGLQRSTCHRLGRYVSFARVERYMGMW